MKARILESKQSFSVTISEQHREQTTKEGMKVFVMLILYDRQVFLQKMPLKHTVRTLDPDEERKLFKLKKRK